MKVTEVRVKLNQSGKDRLRGFCSITLDNDFAIRDIKIIEGPGGLFVAMPSRKLMDHCPRCHSKNHLRARFCNHCGSQLGENRHGLEEHAGASAGAMGMGGRSKFHCDVAHPINAVCRAAVQQAIVHAYTQELEHSKQPGYVPPKWDDMGDELEAPGGS